MSVATGCPTRRRRRAPRERGVDARRHDHAAERGDGGQRGGAPVAQLARDQLALDLQAGEQEEQRHEPVVDERHGRPCPAARRGQLNTKGAEQGLVAVVPRRVGPQQRHDRGGQHDQPPAASTWVKRSAGRTKARGTKRSESRHVGHRRGRLGRGRAADGALLTTVAPARRARDPERSGPHAQPVGHASTVALDEAGASAGALVPTPL